MNLEQVKNLNQRRMIAEASLEQKNIENLIENAVRKEYPMPRLDEAEQLVFKIRTELIDYIVEHGLIQGFEWDRYDQKIEGGKIVITKEMIKDVLNKLDYYTETEIDEMAGNLQKQITENQEGVEKNEEAIEALKQKDSDLEERLQTEETKSEELDGRLTTAETKLSSIEENAEVNKVDDVTLDGVSVVDEKIAKFTKEDIKESYESNDNTNVFTDGDKEKLAGIDAGAEVNRVVDVRLKGSSLVDDEKIAKLPDDLVQDADYIHTDNNFSDEEKNRIQTVEDWKTQADLNITTALHDIDEIQKKDIEQDKEIAEKVEKAYYNMAAVQESITFEDELDYADVTTYSFTGQGVTKADVKATNGTDLIRSGQKTTKYLSNKLDNVLLISSTTSADLPDIIGKTSIGIQIEKKDTSGIINSTQASPIYLPSFTDVNSKLTEHNSYISTANTNIQNLKNRVNMLQEDGSPYYEYSDTSDFGFSLTGPSKMNIKFQLFGNFAVMTLTLRAHELQWTSSSDFGTGKIIDLSKWLYSFVNSIKLELIDTSTYGEVYIPIYMKYSGQFGFDEVGFVFREVNNKSIEIKGYKKIQSFDTSFVLDDEIRLQLFISYNTSSL